MTALNMLKPLGNTVETQILLYRNDGERYIIIFIYLEENTKCAKKWNKTWNTYSVL